MKYIIKSLLVVIMIALLHSCYKYPSDVDRLQESLVVSTQYDVSADFGEYKTFVIPDSIAVIDQKDSAFLKNANTDLIINQIVANMESRGYQRVNNDGDLGISVAFFKNVNITVYYPGWWWGYPGYYPPGYWGYPGYGYGYGYYPTYVTSYSVGTITIEMFDIKNAPLEEVYYIRWNAYIRGLLSGNHTSTDIVNSIDQAFIQTPQLSASSK
jgi:hypothetical protein